MKKLLIMCGTGVATSTVVTNKVKEWLKKENMDKEVKIIQSKVSDEVGRLDEYDVVLSTTTVPERVKDKVIDGVPLLTGINVDEMYKEIKDKLS
ncbi:MULTISPECIES: PTS sugar transporter subunit IIB [Dolosigranulum]|uniref:PTS galactitol transporter subunit IIB n=2 Tax=Dolosigranulum TaxID=29393 RepID=A0A516GHB8_9LACT|nr:PTS sugar transporter subunit IIB [Dolosigranulum pigrum]QDO90919.1 PTS galactitol transporter subunit IIB [Dolosigranulum pigrum]QTJ42771.1 PTS galactitol transporter subunit IIB [Dolosigranulum pigrum]QTJ46168.1 PTS galactitol transporter subunit IIB [Dolosigranulum pigrum]QTJ59687.1 PTS galactitol transporter subunit IIB [Dolosigranulum pigrum]